MFADGKIYVGTDNGSFFIVRPQARQGGGAERSAAAEQHQQLLWVGGDAGTGSRRRRDLARPCLLRIERRRIRDWSAPRDHTGTGGCARVRRAGRTGRGAGVSCRSSPTELVLEPGQTVKLRARLFDDKGRFLREEKATWALEALQGTVTDGSFTVANKPIDQAGTIKATVGALSGTARARVVRSMPWTEDFESYMDKDVPAGLGQPGGGHARP